MKTASFIIIVSYFASVQPLYINHDNHSVSEEKNLTTNRTHTILSKSPQTNSEICPSSSDDFPVIFSDGQLDQGGIVLVFAIGVYCFTLLAIVCDNYFLPCVERICEALNLSPDVAAATFMSIATSAPELFTNIIGTFLTESDIGIGTVVGSSLFNVLGVAAIGGLAAAKSIQLDWFPLTRDVIIYICAVALLVGITHDGHVYWYEGLVLFIIYFMYFTLMFQNKRVSNVVMKLVKKFFKEDNKVAAVKSPTPSVAVISVYGSYAEEPMERYVQPNEHNPPDEDDDGISLFRFPRGAWWKKILFFYTWPLKIVLFCTVPDPKRFPKLFPVTFILCIFYIGSNSYVVSWMISIIGKQFSIPDAVLGLTFLAAGGCTPEAISITIMSRRGEGSMGVSNSLGANTMNILMSLGMPWFLKTITMTEKHYIVIDSGSIEYTISALIPVALILYLTLYFNKFRLCKRVGVILMLVYTACITLAILAEMVFFADKNASDCEASS